MTDRWMDLNKRARLERYTAKANLIQHDEEKQVYHVPTKTSPPGTYYDVRIRKTDIHRTIRVTCAQVNPLGQGKCPGNTYNGTVCRHVLVALTNHYSAYQLRFYSTEKGARNAGNPIHVISGDGKGEIWIVGKRESQ